MQSAQKLSPDKADNIEIDSKTSFTNKLVEKLLLSLNMAEENEITTPII